MCGKPQQNNRVMNFKTNLNPKLSIRSVFLLTFALFVAVPIALFWFWPLSHAMQNERNEVRERHLLLAQNIGVALQRYHRDVVSAFEFFASQTLGFGQSVEAGRVLKNLKIRQICRIDPNTGKVIFGFTSNPTKCPDRFSTKKLTIFKSIAVEGQTVLTGVMPNPEGNPTIYLVRQSKGQLEVGSLNTNYFVELGKTIAFGKKGHAAIVDQFGKVLAHPLPKWVAAMKDISKVSAVNRMLAGQTGVETFYSPALKDDMIAGFTVVKGPGWGVMIPQPISELKQVAWKVQREALTIFAIGLLIAVLVSFFATIPVLRSLTALTRGVKQLETGEPNGQLEIPNRFIPVELHVLLTAFNSMVESVLASAKALKSGEQQFRQLVEDSTQGVIIHRDHKLLFANQAAADIHGYKNPEGLLSVGHYRDLIAPEEFNRLWGNMTARQKGEYVPDIFEAEGLRKDGSRIYLEIRVTMIDWLGKPAIQNVIIDITERKKTEILNLRLAQIVEDSINEIFVFDAETLKFLQVNASACKNTGYSMQEFEQMTPLDLKPNTTFEQFDSIIAPLKSGVEDHIRFETIHRRKDGSLYDASIILQQIGSGNRPVFAAIIEDVSNMNKAKKMLVEHRDQLQVSVDNATRELKVKANELEEALGKEKELNRLQKEFVSMASHEFRTPLAIIDSSAQRLKSRINKNKLTPDDAVERVETIRGAVQRMTRLMESTLSVARVESGKVKIEFESCDIAKIMQEVCTAQQEVAKNPIAISGLADLPEAIQGDASSLEQMFTNLISNAVKYTPDGSTIEVTGSTQDHHVVISVHDHGIGIDEEDMDRIGERFFRAKSSTGIEGTGIGLNLVKILVEEHGGTIQVKSAKDKGSTFTISLPISGLDQSQQSGARVA
jgi:PAS domain S-box-containing protein